MVTFEDILSWRGETFEEAAVALRQRAQVYEDSCETLKKLMPQEFQGAAAEAEARARRALIDDAQDIQRIYEQASSRFRNITTSIEELVARVKKLAAYFSTNPIAACPSNNTEDCTYEEGYLYNEREHLKNVQVAEAKALITQIAEVYSLLEGLTKTAEGAVSSIIQHGVKQPRSEWTAHEVNDWWTALSPEEQEKIVAEHPEWIGNLGGIPFEVRHRANLAMIDRYLAEIEKEIEKEEEILRRPTSAAHARSFFGNPFYPYRDIDHSRKLTLLLEKRRDLLLVRQRFSGNYDPRYSLVSLDAWSGEHLHASIGIGKIDEAKHIMVHTPGMYSTVGYTLVGEGKEWGSGVTRVENVLKIAADRQGTNGMVAGIIHLNYDAPDNFLDVISNYRAQQGGTSAASLMEAVQATHNGDPHLVNSGHSYGSVAAGYAMRSTMVADDFTAMGSPGITATDNLSLRALPGHVLVGKAANDKIAGLGHFGGHPESSPLFQHWSTEEWVGPKDVKYEASSGHSEYMKAGSTSAYNLASILIGEGVAAPGK